PRGCSRRQAMPGDSVVRTFERKTMQEKTKALRRAGRARWAIAALVLCAAALTAPAAQASPPSQKRAAASWAVYHPRGWSAGSVSIGTGYHRRGASSRVRDV